MITLIYGLPRSGKSYTALEQYVLPALEKGRPVLTFGIEINDARPQTFKQASELVLAEVPGGCLVLVDEAWRLFPSGQKQANIPEALREFLALHGHNTDEAGNPMDIVLMCQGPEQLAGWVRALVDQVVWITANRASGLTLRRRRRWEGGKTDGDPIEDASFSINPAIAGMYKSTRNVATEKASQGPQASVWRNKWVIAAGVFVPVLAGTCLYFGAGLLKQFRSKGQVQKVSTPEGARAPSANFQPHQKSASYVPAPPQAQTYTPVWRLAAVLDYGSSKSVAALVNEKGIMVTMPLSTCFKIGDTINEWACPFNGKWIWRAGEWSGLLSQ